jgi:hypothetical protein
VLTDSKKFWQSWATIQHYGIADGGLPFCSFKLPVEMLGLRRIDRPERTQTGERRDALGDQLQGPVKYSTYIHTCTGMIGQLNCGVLLQM